MAQFTWPPQDPDRYPARRLPYSSSSSSAFTYGNGDFNPALRPAGSSSRSRLRERKSPGEAGEYSQAHESRIPGPLPPHLSGRPDPEEECSSGEEREREDKQWTTDDEDGSLTRSSPEPFLSDFDDDNDDDEGDGRGGDKGVKVNPNGRVKVRRGSEGFEIAPKRRWDAELDPQ
jgi:hypothetical protein